MVTQGTLRKTILGVGVKRLSGGSRVFGGVCFGDFPISAKQEQRRLGRVSMDEGVAEIEESDYSEESESTENCRIEGGQLDSSIVLAAGIESRMLVY
ncbi:hypothetical protein U1Q18_009917 [Sarracenia purpurea var. burkii]